MSEKTKYSPNRIGLLIFMISMAISLILLIIMKYTQDMDQLFYYIAMVAIGALFAFSIKLNIDMNKEIKSYRNFLKNGKLIKDLPFVKHNIIEKNGKNYSKTAFIAVVDYKTKEDKIITIGGEYGLSIEKYGDRETVDLYIDETNLNNYIIDFDLEDKIKNNELL